MSGPKFSESFERGLRRHEKHDQPVRPPARMKPCLLPTCSGRASGAGPFELCPQHLLDIWRYVDKLDDPESLKPSVLEGGWIGRPLKTVTWEEQEAARLVKREKALKVARMDGMLYALDTADGWVKIGWTSRPLASRMAQYPPNFRFIVAVAGTRADERDVHRSLKPSRVSGREWYEPTREVVRQINEWIAQANILCRQMETDVLAKAPNRADLNIVPVFIERYAPDVERPDAQRAHARSVAHNIQARAKVPKVA